MFHEDVTIGAGETVASLASDYGHKAADAATIWANPWNAAVARLRGVVGNAKVGDRIWIPIPWKVTAKVLTVEARGVGFEVTRDGEPGTRVSWVQTVYQGNQPAAGTTVSCVDACPADDADPFYWTAAELTATPALRNKFVDHPARNAPVGAMKTTNWRAIVSLAVVTGKRVKVFKSLVWGFDRPKVGLPVKVGPRAATGVEVTGHLTLLRTGKGTLVGDFKSQGWTFVSP